MKIHILPLLDLLINLQLNKSLLKNSNTQELREDCKSLSQNLFKSIQASEQVEYILEVITNATKSIKSNISEVKTKVDTFIGILTSEVEEQKL